MDLLNGHTLRLLEAFQDQLFGFNPTGRFSALLTILSIHKNADRSAMARTGCYMPLALATVVDASCARSVRKAVPR
jgi:hypothetical protein